MPPTEVTRTSTPTSSTLMPGNTMPLQVPSKNIRSNSVNQNDPKTSEKVRSQDISSGVNSHQV